MFLCVKYVVAFTKTYRGESPTYNERGHSCLAVSARAGHIATRNSNKLNDLRAG
jgi:hypothetical protein